MSGGGVIFRNITGELKHIRIGNRNVLGITIPKLIGITDTEVDNDGVYIITNDTIINGSTYISSQSRENREFHFTNINDSSNTIVVQVGDSNSTSIPNSLVSETVYSVTFRDIDVNGTVSDFSTPILIKSPAIVVYSPTISTSNADIDRFVVSFSEYSSNNTNATLTHIEYHVSTTSSFSKIVVNQKLNSTNTNNRTITGLQTTQTYYIRARYWSNSVVSDWSNTSSIVTVTPFINQPTIASTSTMYAISTTHSNFVSNSSLLTLAAIEYQMSTSSNFSTEVINRNITTNSTMNRTHSNFESATTYYVRARYRTTTNHYSNWSNSTTTTTITPIITKPTATLVNIFTDLPNNISMQTYSNTYNSTNGGVYTSTEFELYRDGTRISNPTISSTSTIEYNVLQHRDYTARLRHWSGKTASEWSDMVSCVSAQQPRGSFWGYFVVPAKGADMKFNNSSLGYSYLHSYGVPYVVYTNWENSNESHVANWITEPYILNNIRAAGFNFEGFGGSLSLGNNLFYNTITGEVTQNWYGNGVPLFGKLI